VGGGVIAENIRACMEYLHGTGWDGVASLACSGTDENTRRSVEWMQGVVKGVKRKQYQPVRASQSRTLRRSSEAIGMRGYQWLVGARGTLLAGAGGGGQTAEARALDLSEGVRRDEAAGSGCTSGTAGPRAWGKAIFERSRSVPRQRSASGSTTLKFLCM
jgi:hypothetical protein